MLKSFKIACIGLGAVFLRQPSTPRRSLRSRASIHSRFRLPAGADPPLARSLRRLPFDTVLWPAAGGWYQPAPHPIFGCPPGYWHGPWGHCRDTPYHGRLPGGGWK